MTPLSPTQSGSPVALPAEGRVGGQPASAEPGGSPAAMDFIGLLLLFAGAIPQNAGEQTAGTPGEPGSSTDSSGQAEGAAGIGTVSLDPLMAPILADLSLTGWCLPDSGQQVPLHGLDSPGREAAGTSQAPLQLQAPVFLERREPVGLQAARSVLGDGEGRFPGPQDEASQEGATTMAAPPRAEEPPARRETPGQGSAPEVGTATARGLGTAVPFPQAKAAGEGSGMVQHLGAAPAGQPLEPAGGHESPFAPEEHRLIKPADVAPRQGELPMGPPDDQRPDGSPALWIRPMAPDRSQELQRKDGATGLPLPHSGTVNSAVEPFWQPDDPSAGEGESRRRPETSTRELRRTPGSFEEASASFEAARGRSPQALGIPRVPVSPAGLERVATAVRMAVSQGGGEVRLRLHPESLGDVQVRVRWEGGVLTARLEASSPAARDALEAGLQTLRTVLQEQGVPMDTLQVGVRLNLEARSHPHDFLRQGSAAPAPSPEPAENASGGVEPAFLPLGRLDLRI